MRRALACVGGGVKASCSEVWHCVALARFQMFSPSPHLRPPHTQSNSDLLPQVGQVFPFRERDCAKRASSGGGGGWCVPPTPGPQPPVCAGPVDAAVWRTAKGATDLRAARTRDGAERDDPVVTPSKTPSLRPLPLPGAPLTLKPKRPSSESEQNNPFLFCFYF